MRQKLLTLAIASTLLVAAVPGFADHNSKNGEGWANMPNDIHNTRIETRESGDTEAFKDFVKYGDGSDSVNRFDSDDTQAKKAVEQKGKAQRAKNQGESKVKAENKVKTQTATMERKRMENRSRVHIDAAGMSRNDRAAGNRSSGGRRGNRNQ